MGPALRNGLAVMGGLLGGSLVNGSLIGISGSVIPPPAGADVTTMEGLKASMHLFEPKHFLMPFLAHALGTVTGAFQAAKFGVTRQWLLAGIVGMLFFAGGLTNVMLLPSPVWFNLTDLAVAYGPMAWIGGKLAGAK